MGNNYIYNSDNECGNIFISNKSMFNVEGSNLKHLHIVHTHYLVGVPY